jgi:hypothetical protein
MGAMDMGWRYSSQGLFANTYHVFHSNLGIVHWRSLAFTTYHVSRAFFLVHRAIN